MADENKEQQSGQEQEPVQGEEPALEPEETVQPTEEEKKEGLLMPVLYALLAGVGAFTLVMIVGIVLTFFFHPADPEETPSGEESAQVTLAPSPDVTDTQAPQEPDGEDSENGGDTGDADSDNADAQE